jgi:hypothetical protein
MKVFELKQLLKQYPNGAEIVVANSQIAVDEDAMPTFEIGGVAFNDASEEDEPHPVVIIEFTDATYIDPEVDRDRAEKKSKKKK